MDFITAVPYNSYSVRGTQILTRGGKQLLKVKALVCIKTVYKNLSSNISVYIDLVDSDKAISEISKDPTLSIITLTPSGRDYIAARVPNRVIVIPDHHCNNNNIVRTRTTVDTIGYCGNKLGLQLDVEELQAQLEAHGFKFLQLDTGLASTTLSDILNFYKSIDINLLFRKPYYLPSHPPEMRSCLKLTNAGSFGIPTIAYPELLLQKEAPGMYLPAKTIPEIVNLCKLLQEDTKLYEDWQDRSIAFSKPYHIDNIIKNYYLRIEEL